MQTPFRVLGGGPAGLTAAITAAQRGASVELYEYRSACGSRFHGDFQGIENWSGGRSFLNVVSEWGIDLEGLFVAPFRRTDIIGPHGERHTARSHRPAVHVVRRGTAADSLDQCLYRAALRVGVRFFFHQTRPPNECHVVATGPRRPTGYVTGLLFETSHPDRTAMWLSRRVAPGGYGYLICARGQGLVAATVVERGRSASSIRQGVLRGFKALYPGLVAGPARTFGGIGQFGLASRFEDGGAHVAGEAAGLQDALWGFGIRTAMSSGRLAALAHLEPFDYPVALEAELLPRARVSLVNRWAYERIQDPVSALAVRAWQVEQQLRGDGLPFVQRLYRPDGLRWKWLAPLARRRLRAGFVELNERLPIKGV